MGGTVSVPAPQRPARESPYRERPADDQDEWARQYQDAGAEARDALRQAFAAGESAEGFRPDADLAFLRNVDFDGWKDGVGKFKEQLEKHKDKANQLASPKAIQGLTKILTVLPAGLSVTAVAVSLLVPEEDRMQDVLDKLEALSEKIDKKADDLSAQISEKLLRAPMSSIRYESASLGESASREECTASPVGRDVNVVMEALLARGPRSVLEELYKVLGGGHRNVMEEWCYMTLQALASGIATDMRRVRKIKSAEEAEDFIRRQYAVSKLRKVAENVHAILARFDQELHDNLQEDVDKLWCRGKGLTDGMSSSRDVCDFLSEKYDWLNFAATWERCDGGLRGPEGFCPYFNAAPHVWSYRGAYYGGPHFILVVFYVPKLASPPPSPAQVATAEAKVDEAFATYLKVGPAGTYDMTLMSKLVAERLNSSGCPWWGLMTDPGEGASWSQYGIQLTEQRNVHLSPGLAETRHHFFKHVKGRKNWLMRNFGLQITLFLCGEQKQA